MRTVLFTHRHYMRLMKGGPTLTKGGGAFAMWQWVLASRRGSHYHRANIIIRGAMT